MGPERSAFLHSPVAPLHRMPHSTRPPPHTQRSTSTSASRRNHGPTATNLGATVYDGITPTNTTPMRGTCRTTCHPLTPSTLAAGRHRSQRDLQAAPSHREPVRPRHPTGHYTTPATCPTRCLGFLWLWWLQRSVAVAAAAVAPTARAGQMQPAGLSGVGASIPYADGAGIRPSTSFRHYG